jgi:type VI secretion system secreted protein VgrG
LQGNFKPRNYCVQYDESDFDFASRLMEEEGIYYFFEHTNEKHKMVIANTPQSHPDCPSKSEIAYFVKTGTEEDFITAIGTWQTDHNLQTGKVTLWDYNFQTPRNKLDASQPSAFNIGDNQKLETYQFPAGYARKYDDIDRTGGERADVQNVFNEKQFMATMAMQSVDAKYKEINASSDCPSITPGYKFNLTNHTSAGEYVVVSATHMAEQNPSYVSEDEIEEPYSNTFNCISHGRGNPPFRPLRLTPKPLIRGSQTALVVGPSGEEIFTDKFGRVKVQFHWDREGQADANSSCWIRVAQSWSGNKWGMVFIPRIGMEVIVHFLEGDPDQPIITGCVYNPETMPPYTLPDEKTKSTIKSDSSKGGKGFNEFRIEDEKGKEQIFIHGEKNLDVRIKEDAMELIKRDRHLIIERHQLEEVKKDKQLKVVGDRNEKVDGSVSLNVGSDIQQKTGQKYALDAGQEVHIKSGMNLVIESGTTLTLKVGGNFININSSGVYVKGTMVMLNSGGAAGSGAGANPELPKPPKEADQADPGMRTKQLRSQSPPTKPTFTSPAAAVMINAARNGSGFCEICSRMAGGG